MTAHDAALAAAAMEAMTAQEAALAAAAMEAMTAQEAALAAAAMEAMTAQEAALAAAAMEAMTAHDAALAAAAMEAMTAHDAALAAAAIAAADMAAADKAAALADAKTAADAAQAMALADAKTAADAAQAMALADAKTAADAAQAMALADAKTAADAAQAMALADAKTAADAAQAMALADAKTAADAAQAMALADAKTAADAAQAMALADAKTAADAAQAMALADAKTAADAAQAMALADAKTAADAALKMVQDELAGIERDLADEIAEKEAKGASDKAKAVLAALSVTTSVAPPVKLAASSDSDVTAESAGYTMSTDDPDEITGWRGAKLEKDGAELHVYTNIEDAVATPIWQLYRSITLRGQVAVYDVAATTTVDDILWGQVKRPNSDTATTGEAEERKTTFSGTVLGVEGVFACKGSAEVCGPPAPDEVASSEAVGWTFAPTDPNGTIDVEDKAYLSFGWWLNLMDEDAGKYETDVFDSAVGMAANEESGTGLEGTATYRGAAAGKYAMVSTSDNSATGGHFTASATLTANFDASTLHDAPQDNDNGVSIGGTITDFMTGAASRPNWKVTLMAPVAADHVASITGAVTEWATGGALKGKGTWEC